MNYYIKGAFFNSHYVMGRTCEVTFTTLDALSPSQRSVR